MIIANKKEEFSGFTKYLLGEKQYYLKGGMFFRGERAGYDSIKKLDQIYKENKCIPFGDLFGSFVLIINNGEQYVLFTDNSNMGSFFIASEGVSDDFLLLAKETENKTLNLESVCEMITIGTVYFNKTLLQDIFLSDSNNYYIIKNSRIETFSKEIGDIDTPSSITNVVDFFDDIAFALQDETVTQSLTGGYDSRMVFAALSRKLDLDVFISGDNINDPDIKQANLTANAGNKKLDIIKVEKPAVTEQFLREMFAFSNGTKDYFSKGQVRIKAFLEYKSKQGYNYYLTGDGGPRHKDWNWIQDFPFYRMKKTNLSRYYTQQVEIVKKVYPFSDNMMQEYHLMKDNFIKQLSFMKKPLNTQSYDAFGFTLNSGIVKIAINSASKYVTAYFPLWERELVKYAYALPRRKRFFNIYMRDVITKCNPDIAKVKTVYHMTSSSQLKYKLLDVFGFLEQYMVRALRYLGRKFLKKTFFVGGVETWDIMDKVRELPISERAIEYCKDKNILRDDVNIDTVDYGVLAASLHILLLMEYLE
ncbi:Uncharacterised protein [uncultured Eubacterium sp.]|nr:Uncharacterised protein [uncultured Eubacterium sp.]